jgi:uncharacterized membrane protein (DUF485 family)
MKQSKNKSLIETLTQTFSGLVFSFIIQLILYPLMGIPVTIGQNVIITTVFVLASIVRGYVVRRIFNR